MHTYTLLTGGTTSRTRNDRSMTSSACEPGFGDYTPKPRAGDSERVVSAWRSRRSSGRPAVPKVLLRQLTPSLERTAALAVLQ